jgi:hypothetical protein
VAGPRKVRIFRDLKKSPNWYVEWRDLDGRRHCESCGPQREDARNPLPLEINASLTPHSMHCSSRRQQLLPPKPNELESTRRTG